MHVLDLLSVKGRTAIVTGGAGLYGRCITEGLLEAGCRVIVASRDQSKLAGLQREMSELGYENMAVCRLDQADGESIERFVREIYKQEEEIQILVNNSVARPMRSFDADIAAFRESMEVNATGLFHLTRLIADRMARAGTGSIVNVSSIQGVVGVDPTLYEGLPMSGSIPDYFFHKAGLINLTRFLASHYGKQGVRVNAVSPGGLFNDQNPEFVKRYSDRTMLGRMADRDDIKGLIVFLASEASKYITGENIMLDGGYVQK